MENTVWRCSSERPVGPSSVTADTVSRPRSVTDLLVALSLAEERNGELQIRG